MRRNQGFFLNTRKIIQKRFGSVDILRLKDFQDIKKANYDKIYAYTIYWILRIKPIQTFAEEENKNYDVISEKTKEVNEVFAVQYLASYLKINIKSNLEFLKYIKYHFLYRDITPDLIEMILVSYKSGKDNK